MKARSCSGRKPFIASWLAVLAVAAAAGPARGEHVDYTVLGIEAVNHDIFADAGGTVHIIWKQPLQPISYGYLEGAAVIEVNSIPDSGRISHFHAKPRLAVRSDGGSVHTAWVDQGGSTLVCSSRTDGDWQNEEVWNAGTTAYHMAEPVVGASPDGTLHMIAQRWEDGVRASPIVYFRKLPASGWEDEAIISPDYIETDREYRDTYIWVDDAGAVHASWNRSYGYSSGDGVFEVTELPNRAGVNLYCCGDLFVDPAGVVHDALKGYPLDAVDYAFKPPAGEFSAPVQASLTEGISCDNEYFYETWPGIVTGQDGRIYMVWAEADCVSGGVPFVRLAVMDRDGAWFHQDLDTEADVRTQGRPSIAVARGIVHIIWRIPSGEVVLYTIDTTAGPVEEEDVMEEVPDRADVIEAVEGPPDAAADLPDPSLDAGDDTEGGAGDMSGGCGCRVAG
jgi:hypothetical protein